MNLSAMTGLLVSVIAIIWVAVFIPSWFNRTQEVQVRRRRERTVRVAAAASKAVPKSNIASVAQRSFQLQLVRRVCLTILFASVAGIVFGLVNFVEFWWVSLSSLGAGIAVAFANRAATRSYQNLLVDLRAQRTKAFAARSVAITIDDPALQQPAVENQSAWVPVPVPAPLQKNGTLEEVVLAAVSELPKAKASVTGKDLDLIMKRRRNAG